MAAMAPRDWGIYILQNYASIAGQDKPVVTQNYIDAYGDAELTSLGTLGAGLSIDSINSALRTVASGNLNSATPSRADMNQAMITAGAQPGAVSQVINAVEAGVSQSVDQAGAAAVAIGGVSLTVLKYAAILAVAVGAGYIAWQLGFFKNAAARVRS